jgi:hypothetical protein
MSRRTLPIFLAIMALAATSVSVWAKNDSGDAVSANLKLTATTMVGTTKLAPGDYKVTAEGNKAKFQQGSKVVAEVPCTVKDFGGKINETTFVLEKDQLSEIQVAGKNKAIDFAGN